MDDNERDTRKAIKRKCPTCGKWVKQQIRKRCCACSKAESSSTDEQTLDTNTNQC